MQGRARRGEMTAMPSNISSGAGRSSLGSSPAVNAVNRFLASPGYILAVMLLTAISNILSAELVVYTLFIAVVVYVCLLGDDLLPITPIIVCCYMAPSVANNPGRSDQSVFAPEQGGIYLLCLAAVAAAVLIYRLIRRRHAFFAEKHALLRGILVLFAGYLLSGIGSDAYPDSLVKNLFFAFLQGCSILLPYWLISGGVNWKDARKDYFAWVGFGTGCLLLCQILWIYCSAGVIVDGVIDRTQIYTGWGMYNNMGGMLAMMIPFAFYLATKYRKGWIGTVAGSAFLIGVLLTCSRSSILTGTAIYAVCILLMLYYAQNRKGNTIALVTVIAVLVLVLLLFHRQLLHLFSKLLQRGMDPSSRDVIYREGLELFWEYPIFGCSFFSPGYIPWGWSTAEGFSSFFPHRWHNTAVQLLASCGIVGTAAYLLHRVQTLKLFLRDCSKERAFIGCSVLTLLVCSLFDCHFFNIGPVLFYSMALAFAEHLPKKK